MKTLVFESVVQDKRTLKKWQQNVYTHIHTWFPV